MSLHPSINCSSDTPQTSNRLDPFTAFQEGKSPENWVVFPRAHLHRQQRSGSVLVFVSKDSGPHSALVKGSAASGFLFKVKEFIVSCVSLL